MFIISRTSKRGSDRSSNSSAWWLGERAPRVGQELTVLWYITGGPQTKVVTVERVTKTQIVTIDAAGVEERFRRSDGAELSGAALLVAAEDAERTVEKWHARDAQRRSAHLGRPVSVPEGTDE